MDPRRGRIGPDGLADLLRRAGLDVTGVTADAHRFTVTIAGPEGRPVAVEAGPPGQPALFATPACAFRSRPAELTPGEHARAMLLIGILARLWDRLEGGPGGEDPGETSRIAAVRLSPDAIRMAATRGNAIDAVLETGEPGWQDDMPDRLEALKAVADASGTRLQWVVPATAAGLARPDLLVALAARLRVRTRRDRSLAIEWPDPAATPGALPLLAARGLPEAIVRDLGDAIPLRSRAGRPLCVFPRALERMLLDLDARERRDDNTFGPQCATCTLRTACGGVSRGYAKRFGTGELVPFAPPPGSTAAPAVRPSEAPWAHKLWWLLRDRPWASVALREVLTPGMLPELACVLPWTRLEIHEGGSHGPCCADYLQAPGREPPDTALDILWHGPLMRAVRRAMADGHPTRTCRPTCPVLVGGTDLPSDLVLRGGPEATVRATIDRIADLLAGREAPVAPPAALCFAATSFCNYDCVMCDCGERGTLDDQPDEPFFAQARSWASCGVELEVNGGEPLASPRFRAFLDRLADEGVRPAPVGLVTNGSLLTPGRIDRWAPILRGVVVSLNAADADTYRAVNRGVPWTVVRAHLDHLLAARRDGRFLGGLAYSMVLLRANLEQIPAFVELALADDVDARFLLPQGDRNGQSVTTALETAHRTEVLLDAAAARLESAGRPRPAAATAALARILADRIARNVFDPL